MPTHLKQDEVGQVYFCIVTCYGWLQLINEADAFDAKPCFTQKMIEQKLDYIHRNPVSGRWNLVDDYVKYEHSSACFYNIGVHKNLR